MKKVKYLILLGGILCLFINKSTAQPPDTIIVNGVDKATVIANRMERELELNASQKEKVFKILAKRSEEWKKQITPASNEDKSAFITKVNSKAYNDLAAVLSKQQIEKHQQLRQSLVQQRMMNIGPVLLSEEDLELDF